MTARAVVALVAALFFAPVSSAFAQGTPFVKIGATVSLSVSSISSRVALVTTSPTVWVCNTGATLANVGFGDSGYVATSADTPIPAGLCGNLSPNGGAYMAAITASSTTTITATPGTGAILGAGGGSGSGGGGGGAVTMVSGAVASGAYAAGSLAVGAGADGWDTTEGTKADSAANNSTSSWSVIALLKGLYAQLSSILTAVQNGIGATGSPVPADATYEGGNAQSSEPAKATSGNLTGKFLDLVGKAVTSPFAPRELMWRGGGTSTSTTAITLLAAAGASIKTYMTDLSCTRNDAGTSAITITLSDGSSFEFDVPDNGGGGGWTHTFNVPLVTAANTAFTATPSSGVTTLKCWGSGFTGY